MFGSMLVKVCMNGDDNDRNVISYETQEVNLPYLQRGISVVGYF